MFFDNWSRIGVLVGVTVAAYAALILVLRTSGKRTLSKLNAFDFVITIALGSVLATVVLSRSVPLVEGLFAFALLAALQYLVAFTSVRSRAVRNLVKSSPRVVVQDGEIIRDALEAERITIEELAQAVRKQGHGSFENVGLAVLETDGTFSVIGDAGDGSALAGVDQRTDAGTDTEPLP